MAVSRPGGPPMRQVLARRGVDGHAVVVFVGDVEAVPAVHRHSHWQNELPVAGAVAAAELAKIIVVQVADANAYGGGAQGLRWTFWLIPLWLVALPRGVETVLRSRVGAVIAMGFLGVSVFSMAFALTPSTGPWSQSWLHWLLEHYFEIGKYT